MGARRTCRGLWTEHMGGPSNETGTQHASANQPSPGQYWTVLASYYPRAPATPSKVPNWLALSQTAPVVLPTTSIPPLLVFKSPVLGPQKNCDQTGPRSKKTKTNQRPTFGLWLVLVLVFVNWENLKTNQRLVQTSLDQSFTPI